MSSPTDTWPSQRPSVNADKTAKSSILGYIDNTTVASVSVSVFQTNAKNPNDREDEGQSWGILGLGTKTPMDILYPEAYYKPPGRGTVEHDISDCVHVVYEGPGYSRTTRFIKLRDPVKSDYTFDITVTDFGNQAAKFEGTMNWQGIDYEWTGQCISKGKVDREVTEISLPKPAGLEGTLQELRDISPLAWKNEGKDIPRGTDLAQLKGDEVMQKITVHALDDETKRTLFPNQPPLSPAESSILADSRDYFKRAAVHLIAEQLKKIHQINPKISKGSSVGFQTEFDQTLVKHITYKWKTFMSMMTSFAPPTDGKPDPVVEYGWDRTKDAELIIRLQSQFQEASMRCYLEGYKLRFPEWDKFLKHPVYWFKCFSSLLVSPEHCNRWVHTLIDPLQNTNKNAVTANQEVLLWGNKLSVLKQASPKEVRDQLDIGEVTEYLTSQAQLALAHAQLVNKDLVESTKRAFGGAAPSDMDSGGELYNKAVDSCIRQEAIQILSKAADPTSALAAHLEKYWRIRLPPGAPVDRTVGMLVVALQDEEALKKCMQADGLKPLTPAPDSGSQDVGEWYAKVSYTKIVEASVHGAAYAVLLVESSRLAATSGSKASKEGAEVGRKVAMEITAGLALTFKLVKKAGKFLYKVISLILAQRKLATVLNSMMIKLSQNLASFGKRFTTTLFGSLKNVLRTFGAVLAIIGIFTAYRDAKAAGEVHPNDRDQALIIYSWVQFGLSIASALVAVGAITFQVLGYATAVSACGPIGAVIAGVMLAAFAVYYIWFRPDPYKDVKGFLHREAKPVGSYDESKAVELEEQELNLVSAPKTN